MGFEGLKFVGAALLVVLVVVACFVSLLFLTCYVDGRGDMRQCGRISFRTPDVDAGAFAH